MESDSKTHALLSRLQPTVLMIYDFVVSPATPEEARAVAEAKAAEALRTAQEARILAEAAQKAEARAEEMTKAGQRARSDKKPHVA